MNVEIAIKLRGARLTAWQKLLADTGLSFDGPVDRIALVWDADELIATASRKENLFKYIAVKPNRQGEDLTATVISALRADAFSEGYGHLFLYTKPENEEIFSSLFFYLLFCHDFILRFYRIFY
jgi:[citrate (pro-3S)-lyase] ligase